jgi:molecular chaperone DnaK
MKKILTETNEAEILCPNLSNNKDLRVLVTRQKYEDMCEDLVQRCVPPIVMAMKDAEMNASNIDEVALVGDLTRTPMIARMIEKMF